MDVDLVQETTKYRNKYPVIRIMSPKTVIGCTKFLVRKSELAQIDAILRSRILDLETLIRSVCKKFRADFNGPVLIFN